MEDEMNKVRREKERRENIKQDKHLLLILDNPMTSGITPTACADGLTVICGPKGDKNGGGLALRGAGVQNNHCTIVCQGGTVEIVTDDESGGVVVNGDKLGAGNQPLNHNDRVLIGESNYYRFIDPAVAAGRSEEERASDEVLYTYEYMRDESQKLEKQKLAREAEHTKKALEAKFAAEKEKLEGEAEEKMAQMKAEFEELSKQSGADADDLRAEFEKKMKVQRAELLQEEEELKKKQDKELKKKQIAAEVIAYELRDAIGATRTVSAWASNLNVPIKCEAKIISDPLDQKMKVYVQLTDGVDLTENIVDLQTFQREIFAVANTVHSDAMAALENGVEYIFPEKNPFKVDPSAHQRIGNVSVIMEPLFHMIFIDDEFDPGDNHFKIFSYLDGNQAGLIELDVKPLWPNNENFNFEAYERMGDVEEDKRFHYLDLEITIKKLYNLPQKHSADVKVQLCFPEFIWTQDVGEMSENKEEDDDDDEGTAGAVYSTKLTSTGKGNLQPVLNEKRVIRVFSPFKKKVLNWFQNGALMLGVDGCMPKDPRKKKQERMKLSADPKANPLSATMKGTMGGRGGPAPVQGLPQASGPSAFEMAKYTKLEESMKEKERKMQEQANEIVKLQREKEKLKQELTEAKNKQPSSGACTIS